MPWPLPGRGGTATVLHPTIKEGQRGIPVWALQRALNTAPDHPDVVLDGIYGENTAASVAKFQRYAGLAVDGVAGPRTQRALVDRHVGVNDGDLPRGLLDGFAEMEGGYLLAPLNWSSPGGVDCGAFQRRVYQEDYGNDAVVQRAFDTGYQARLLRDRLLELRGIFVGRAGTRDNYARMPANEKAWRLAALNHNWPSGADILSRTRMDNLSPYWGRRAAWVADHGFKFPDGTPVTTPLHWAHQYAGLLGGAHGHRGNVTKLVVDWTT
jgi:hypothetical protein